MFLNMYTYVYCIALLMVMSKNLLIKYNTKKLNLSEYEIKMK